MKKIVIVSILLMHFGIAFSQSSNPIQFIETKHNFGEILESDGPVTYEFQFKNVSGKPLSITNVKASCGCTTPDWSKKPVPAGEMGYVQAQYNPLNRPYPFNKTLSVYTDAAKQPIVLYISGKVVPRKKTMEEMLPVVMGNLRFQYRNLNMSKVLTTSAPTIKSFAFYNKGEQNIVIDSVEAPKHVGLILDSDTLFANTKGEMKVAYDAKMKNDFGFMNENITLYTTDSLMPIKTFSLFATVEEYFPPMTKEQLANAPQIGLSKLMIDLGKLKKGASAKTVYYLKNNGKSELQIRKVAGNCGCLKIELEKNNIQPGEQVRMSVVFDTTGRRGTQQKSVVIYSNDPKKSAQRVSLKAYVEN